MVQGKTFHFRIRLANGSHHQYKSVGTRYLPGPGPVAEALRRLHYPASRQWIAWETGWSPHTANRDQG